MNTSLGQMNRLITASLMAAVSLLCAASALAAGPTGDHILLITIDDLNDWVGCLSDPVESPEAKESESKIGRGHPQASTPHMDRLAQRGVLFTNAHCQTPICRPSRTGFLSGLRPSTTGVYGNKRDYDAKGRLKPGEDVPWLPKRFELAGYQTFAAGKVAHGGNRGLGQVLAPKTGQGPFPPQKINVPPEVTTAGVWDFGPYPELDRFTDWRIAQWTIGHIKTPIAKSDAPRFFSLGFYRPHVPLFAPQQWFDAAPNREDVLLGATLADDLDDIPAIGRRMASRVLFQSTAKWVREEESRLRGLTQAYLACTSAMDHCLGQVIDALDQSEMADNTWIVVLSDHGWHLGEKDHVAKQTLWERSTHVPLIVVPPRRLDDASRGVRCHRPVELLDVYPTLLDASGVAARASDRHLEGISLMPWVEDPAAPRERPALTTLYCGNHSLCDEKYRYTRYADGSEELYDRKADPHEFDNLISQVDERAELRSVIERLSAWIPREQAGEPDRVLSGHGR
jgi:arylsulfatase A-like enzyme